MNITFPLGGLSFQSFVIARGVAEKIHSDGRYRRLTQQRGRQFCVGDDYWTLSDIIQDCAIGCWSDLELNPEQAKDSDMVEGR